MGRYILFQEKIYLLIASKLKKNQTKYSHIWKNGPPLLFALSPNLVCSPTCTALLGKNEIKLQLFINSQAELKCSTL
jgi:hypothetical protein